MNIIYYCEINLLCIIILILFTNQLHHKSGQLSAENRVFILLIWATILLCVSDIVAGVCRGQVFWGARSVVQVSNLIFFEALAIISYLWMIYVFIKIKMITSIGKKMYFWTIPLIIFSIVAISNPFSNILFKIDENNRYVRNIGIYFHWLVTWSYFIMATVHVLYAIIREKNARKRKEIIPFLYFIIAPAISSIIQMLFYGVTSTQVGITISIVMISLVENRNQILTDALTGLNNRHGFHMYLENYILSHLEKEIFLIMIDLNNLKQVNDKYGHLVGDRALADAADALKKVCEEASIKLFVCRYGGDEFLMVGCDCLQDDMLRLKELIHKKLEEKNQKEINPYLLEASIGIASGTCSNLDDIEHLLRLADESMYDEKKCSKKTDTDVLFG